VPVARCELLDTTTIRGINAYSKFALRELPHLFFEFHGSQASMKEQAETVQAIAAEHGGTGFEWSVTPEERSRLWKARHDAYFACVALRPGCRVLSTDVCVPISQLSDSIAETEAEVKTAPFPVMLVGHVGDGNFHLGMNIDPNNASEVALAESINRRMVERAIVMGGTCSGEHGIGLGKMDFLEREHASGMALMRTLKRAMDPLDLLNPGKLLRLDA